MVWLVPVMLMPVLMMLVTGRVVVSCMVFLVLVMLMPMLFFFMLGLNMPRRNRLRLCLWHPLFSRY